MRRHPCAAQGAEDAPMAVSFRAQPLRQSRKQLLAFAIRSRPTPTDSLSPPTAAVQAPGALQFPPGRRPHPIPDRFSPPSAVTKCRFGAPSAMPNLSRRCAARPSFARCRAHGAAHSERKRPLFRSCAPLPGDVPPPARPIQGCPRPLISAATPCVFFILCAVGGLRFCLLSHFP